MDKGGIVMRPFLRAGMSMEWHGDTSCWQSAWRLQTHQILAITGVQEKVIQTNQLCLDQGGGAEPRLLGLPPLPHGAGESPVLPLTVRNV